MNSGISKCIAKGETKMSSSATRWMTFVATSLLVVTLSVSGAAVSAATGARIQVLGARHQSYSIIDLGTLGGTTSQANGITNNGLITGAANLRGNHVQHAVIWVGEQSRRAGIEMMDLGTLGGPNSGVFWPIKDDRGAVAGVAETSTTDPLAENFCSFGTSYVCLGFLWHNGVMTPLPTLGGNNSEATGVNNRDQVVGIAETSTRDPHCVAPQVLDWEAVVWQNGHIHQLPPFTGDAVAGALGINNRGDVIGGSGVCGSLTPTSIVHALLWHNGRVINLGSFGGTINNLATAINNRGQVVGFSDLNGDATGHAFLWQNGVMTDLGTLPGDFGSGAFGINDRGQVVGNSCDRHGNCRAFLWENGVMTDLNDVVAHDTSLYLMFAGDINNSGEIVGVSLDRHTGRTPAFLAVPCNCKSLSTGPGRRVILPERVRRMFLEHKGFGRFLPGV